MKQQKKTSHLHRIYHHVRHTRPRWYHEYHQWKHHNKIHWITLGLSAILMLTGFTNALLLLHQYASNSASAATGTTAVTQQVNGGTLSVSPQATATLSTVTVSTSNQNSTGSLGTITVDDNRGTGVGWSTTASSTHFIKYNTPVRTGGAAGTLTVDSTATYNNSPGGTYTIAITTGGTLGTAKFSVSGLETLTNQTTGASVSVGSFGLVLDFAAATYTTSDAWTIRVDELPVTGFSITPSTPTANFGVMTGVTGGSQHTFASTADTATIMTASSGNGMGEYCSTPSAQLVIPGNSYANTYTATFTVTVN